MKLLPYIFMNMRQINRTVIIQNA